MAFIIDLAPDVEKELQQEAAQQGVKTEDYVKRLVLERPLKKPMSGAEAIAYWERENAFGTFADRPEDSPELARILRQEAETRDWSAEQIP
jgi:hypothetical protein